jgi:hypothetical protein
VYLLGSKFFSVKDSGSKNKEDRVRAHPFVGADDDYDEEKTASSSKRQLKRSGKIQDSEET